MKETRRRPAPVPASIDRRLRAAGVLIVPALLTLAAGRVEAEGESPRRESHVWLDRRGEPLPFQAHEEILDYLRTASVVEREPIGRGVAGTERLLLERDGVRARAAFRTVDETRRGPFEGLPPSYRRVRDAAILECAAYEVSQALGLGRVPPTVWRTVGEKKGSVQIWLEGTRTQDAYLARPQDPTGARRWNRQKEIMHVFDALIANIDRNQGNILVDPRGGLWFIDHTRSFAPSKQLPEPAKVARCSRELWAALRTLDEASLWRRVEPFLRKAEIQALFGRRAELVKHIDGLIEARGEAAVLFELGPLAP